MLIGLTGQAGAGKDTVCDVIAEIAELSGFRFARRSFAAALYESAAAALGVDEADLSAWKRDKNVRVFIASIGRDGVRVTHSLSVRQFLQRYGYEAHRCIFGSDFWIKNVVLNDHNDKVVCVTDCRFENEAAAIKQAGGYVIRVIGPQTEAPPHPSERPLRDGFVDYVIDNSDRDSETSLASLREQVLRLCERLGIPAGTTTGSNSKNV